MKDRSISKKSDRRLGSREGSVLEPQLCFPAVTEMFRQCDLSLSLPMRCFFDTARKSARILLKKRS